MKMNVSGQGACSNTKRFELELARKISVRWLGHASAVQPAATRHPVHIFFSVSTLLFSSVLTMTQNLVVWVGHQGARPKLENLRFLSSSGVFVGTRIEE
jgi:hypothetical protein